MRLILFFFALVLWSCSTQKEKELTINDQVQMKFDVPSGFNAHTTEMMNLGGEHIAITHFFYPKNGVDFLADTVLTDSWTRLRVFEEQEKVVKIEYANSVPRNKDSLAFYFDLTVQLLMATQELDSMELDCRTIADRRVCLYEYKKHQDQICLLGLVENGVYITFWFKNVANYLDVMNSLE